METAKFDQWCIVEVMGHVRLAGKVSEQAIGGSSFIRVDVPETKQQPAFTRFYGAGSIYSMSPVTEEAARACAERFTAPPIDIYDVRQLVAKLPKPQGTEDDPGDLLGGEDE